MKANEILKSIKKVDKKIFNIYDLIKEKELYNQSFEQEKIELKNLILVEDYLYSKLDIEQLKMYINKSKIYEFNDLIGVQLYNTYIGKKQDDMLIEEMIKYRIFNKIFNMLKLKEKKFNDMNNEEKFDVLFPKNINEIEELNKEIKLEELILEKDKVFTFNDEVRIYLINQAKLDIVSTEIIFLELESQNTNYSKFYIERIYSNVFMDKGLEERIISSDFDIDKLFHNLYVKEDTKTPNQKFVYWYRSHFIFNYIRQLLKQFFYFQDNYFSSECKEAPYYEILYEMNLFLLNANIMLLNDNDYLQFKLDSENILNQIKKISNINIITSSLQNTISEENYQKLKKIMNL